MKKLMLAVMAIMGMQAFASTNDWFDAGIKDYANWPTNEIVGAGTWSGTGGAGLIGVDGARRLALTGDETLKFAVTADPPDVITHVFSTSVKFPDGRELADPSSAKGGVGVKRVDSEDDEAPLAYFGIVKDGETNVWTRLYGAEPSLERDVQIEMLTCASRGEGVDDTVRVVQYIVDGAVLSNAQNEVWFRVGMMADEFKTEVAYAGSGEVAALSGEVEVIDYPMSELTVPEVAGATPMVTSRGATILPNEEGRYVVPQGFEVTVSYTIDEDYRVIGGETVYTITPAGETSELQVTLVTKEYSDVYKFLRFVAFDGIPSGETEADADINEWIELQNTGDKSIDLKDVKFIIGKKKDVNKNPEDAKCKLVFEEGTTLAAGATLRLDEADWTEKGWEKITNGDLIFILTDAEGVEVQKGEISQSAFPHYYGKVGTEVIPATETEEAVMGAGGDTYLYTRNFAHELVNGDWSDSYVPDVPGSYSAKFNSVYISEFMAKNKGTITSKCGIKESDWIELTNGSGEEVDLTGWALSDDPEDLFQVKFPAGTKIGAGETLLVFCDKKPPACEKEIHVKLSLSTDAGEYLILTDPNTNVTTKICYDAQMSDVSCGFGHIEEPIKLENTQYRIGAEGEWKETTGGIGMTAVGGYFAMKYWIVSSAKVPDFDTALDYVKRFEPTKSYNVKTISFVHSDSGQKDNPVNEKGTHIGLAQGSYAYSDMVIDTFDAVINIPEAGDWTFAVSNAAYASYGALGARLELQRNDTVFTLENDDNVGASKNSKLLKGTFAITEPGAYELKLTYSGGLNGSANKLFLFAGKVNPETDEVTLRLVNKESDSEALRIVGRPALEYATDVREEMLGKATKAEWKASFILDGEVSAQDSYYVKAQFADGLVATVNGVVLKELATVKRSEAEELAWTEIMIPQDLLKPGENEVVLMVENDAINDQELLANAVVVKTRKTEELVYFPEPTPGNLNTTMGRTAPTKKVTLSEPHGYKTGAFELTMSCEADPEAKIYYTLDGTAPTVEKGIRYEGPITISSTTCVRAAVPDAASILQNDTSATYLYLDDILTQPRYKSGTLPDFYKDKGFIATGNGRADLATGTQRMRYGFNSTILGQEGARKRVIDGMTNGIDTIALVIDPKNLFDKSTGIYRNAVFSGRAWERATMIEGICPTNSANDFAIQAGLRIRGGSSRQVDHPKHSFRFYFRSDYGAGDLKAKIFGDEGTDTFDKLDLRTSQNWSLSNENSRHDTFIHETFLRDTQRDMGEPYTRSRYYHLYINGIYWGLYETQERIDEDFSETYLGGDADDFDIIKRSMDYNGAGQLQGAGWEVAAGTSSAYTKMGNLAVAGLETMEKYLEIQGLNADGTRNAEYPIYVNPANLMKYVLINHYTCNIDSPFGTGDMNNLYAVRNRVDGETGAQVNGFTFFCHDGEHSMGTDTTADEHRKDSSGKLEDGADWRRVRCHYNRTDMTFLGTSKVSSRYGRVGTDDDDLFGPGELNYRLMQNAEYRMAFADMVYKMCVKDGGALTVPVAMARFEKRMDEIDDAIMGEIARWDWDDTSMPLPNHATWENACGECLEFIEKRLPYLIQGYREAGWYPTNEPPAIAAQDGVITLSSTNENVTLYYTLDGSDPRAVGGAVAGTQYTEGVPVPATGATIKVRSLSADGTWSALNELKVEGEIKPVTQAEAVRVAAVYSSTTDGGDVGEFVVLTNVTEGPVDLTGITFACCKRGKTMADLFTIKGGSLDAGASVTITQAEYGWEKITNGEVDMTLKDGNGALIQTLYIDADWWNQRCDETGIYFVAKEFGDTVTEISQWRPSVSWVEENLRFYEIEGIPAGGGEAGEYFVLSNLSDSAELDLTGVKIFIGKKDDVESDGDAAAKCKLTLAGGTAAAHSTLKFKQPDYAESGWSKITDGDLILKIYDAEGALVQYSEIAQKSFDGYKVGQKALRATSFERETGTADWIEVDLPQSGSKVEGDGFLFYLAGEFAEPAVIAPTGDTCCVVLDGATVPGITLQGAGEFMILASNENKVASLSASAAKVTVEGDGALRFEGANTLVSVSNLTVKSGTFAVKSTGVSATKTPVVNVLGSVKQSGGVIDVDLDVATDLQIYGIYVANKNMTAEFSGGTFTAKVGGKKSAAVYGEKGSVDPTFSGDVNVVAALTGPEARFVNAEGNVKLKGGTFNVTMPDDCASLTNARVFKATKDVKISGGTFAVKVPAAGSEIFSSDREIIVSGGVLSLESADDCFSATGNITISAGVVQAVSTEGDAIDSNGSVTISGGEVFAFTCSADHDAIDVDPILTEESSPTHEITILEGATVVAVGGDQEHFHQPDAGTTAAYVTATGLKQDKKYVIFSSVVTDETSKTKTTRYYAVNWNGKHPETFTLIIAAPGFDKTYSQGKNPADSDASYVEIEGLDKVYVKTVVEPLPTETEVKPGLAIEIAAATPEEATEQVTLAVEVPVNPETSEPVVDEATYKGYFVLTAKPVEGRDGVFTVEAVLNEAVVTPAIEATNEIETPFEVGEAGGAVTIAAKPGLYYSLLRGETVDNIDSVRECKLATGTTVELSDTEKLPNAAFYRIQVSSNAL